MGSTNLMKTKELIADLPPAAAEMLEIFRDFVRHEEPEAYHVLFPAQREGAPANDHLHAWGRLLSAFQSSFHAETSWHVIRVMNKTGYHTERIALKHPDNQELQRLHAEIEAIRIGARLHDIGKIRMIDLLDKTGILSNSEWARIRRHSDDGYEFLRLFKDLPDTALEVVRFHHERWDGKGYPLGLCGEQIPLAARLFQLVEVYNALRFERSYRGEDQKRWERERVINYIAERAGTEFDPFLAPLFIDNLNWLTFLAE